MTPQATSLARLTWQEVFWPQPLLEGPALGLLRHWAAQVHAPQLILEARADREGVRYLVGCQRRHAARLAGDIESLVPGTIVTTAPGTRGDATTTRRLRLVTDRHALTAIDSDAVTRSVLSALAAVRSREQLVLQTVLGPRLAPQRPLHVLPETDQGIASRLLHGVQPERGGAKADVIRKLGEHGFAAALRIGVTASTPARRQALLTGLAGALGTINAPGARLVPRPESTGKLNTPSPEWSFWSRADRLVVTELIHLTAWPVSDSSSPRVPYPGQPPAHPRHVRPTHLALKGDRIVGRATAPGVDGQLGLGLRDSLHHLWLLGPTGTGKSTLLRSLIAQDMAAGRAVVVIEPKDLVSDVLTAVPEPRRDDVVIVDPLDAAPVGINPLQRYGRSPQVVADHLFGVFHALYGDQLGPRSSDILRNCLLVLASRDDTSLDMLPLLLSNPGFRRSLTQRAIRDDPIAAGSFWHWFDTLSADAASQVTAPLMNQLRPLLTTQLRGVLAQRNPRFNIRQVLREQKILLVPLQKGTLGPEAAELLGALVVAELWQAIRERAASPASQRQPVMVYLDEVQEYLRLPTDLGDALATARSLGAAFHLAHQYLGQLPPAMRVAFEANGRSRISFQLSPSDARAMSAGQSVLSPEDFSALPNFHIYAALVHSGAVQPWASGRTLPPSPAISRPADLRARSRARYGQPLHETTAAILGLLAGDHGDDDTTLGRRRRGTS